MNSNRNASITAVQRLNQDYLKIKKDPVPFISAEPLPSNILEWHYLVRGPEKTPYEGGYYHGKLIFPREFPFKPPSIYMITPNGRFACNSRLCLSISDHHPDTWNPVWSVSTILTGLLSFMVGKDSTLGSVNTSDETKRQLSAQSLAFNLQDREFCELFPDVVDEIGQKQKAQKEQGILLLPQQPPHLSDNDNNGEPHHRAAAVPHYEPPDVNADRDLRLAMELSARAQEEDEHRRRKHEEEELERVLQMSLAENAAASGFKFSGSQRAQQQQQRSVLLQHDEMRKQEEEELERTLQLSQRDDNDPSGGLDPDLRLAMELSARAQQDDEHRRMQQENEELERILQLSLTEH